MSKFTHNNCIQPTYFRRFFLVLDVRDYMRHVLLIMLLVLVGCAASSPAQLEPAVTFTNMRDYPIERATLSYRRGPVSMLSSLLAERVIIAIDDLQPGETVRVVPDSPAQDSVRLWLDWVEPGDNEFTTRRLSAGCYFPSDGAMPAVVFWPEDEITLIKGELPPNQRLQLTPDARDG